MLESWFITVSLGKMRAMQQLPSLYFDVSADESCLLSSYKQRRGRPVRSARVVFVEPMRATG